MDRDLLAFLHGDDFALDADDFVRGLGEPWGVHHEGAWDDDPEMLEYSELVELGQSLGSWGGNA